jgi:hypothetical protein
MMVEWLEHRFNVLGVKLVNVSGLQADNEFSQNDLDRDWGSQGR